MVAEGNWILSPCFFVKKNEILQSFKRHFCICTEEYSIIILIEEL